MAGLVATIVTPGSIAPCASDTLPWMTPVLLAPPPCANTADAIERTPTRTDAPINQRFIATSVHTNRNCTEAPEARNAPLAPCDKPTRYVSGSGESLR